MNVHPAPSRFVKNQPALIRALFVGLGLAALFSAPAARADDFTDITVSDTAEIGWLNLDHDLNMPDGGINLGMWTSWAALNLGTDGSGNIINNASADEVNWIWNEGTNWIPENQMILDPAGNLTLNDPLGGNTTLIFDPGDGIIGNPAGPLTLSATDTLLLAGSQVALGANGVLTLTDPVSTNTIVLDPGNETVTVGGVVISTPVMNNFNTYNSYYLDPSGFSLDATTGAIAQGHNVTSDGSNGTVAMGSNTVVAGAGAVALGLNSTASGLGSVALGRFSSATGIAAVAFGGNNTVTGNGTAALGSNLTVTADHALAAGQFNADVSGSGGNAPIFELGNGTSGSLHNAIVVLQNGDTSIPGNTTFGSGNATVMTVNSTIIFTSAMGDIPVGPYGD